MAKKNEKQKLLKKGWVSSFNLIGEAKINDYTYKIDENSTKSDWVYNLFNLGVDCGKYGTIFAKLMGGYGKDRDNVIYVHGKDDDGKDDFDNKFQIAWEDRFDENILEDVGDMCFIKIGIEKDKNDKTFTKRFLTPYDAISYIKEVLEDGMVINVKGNLKYSPYNNHTNVEKEIKSIYLSKVEDKSKYKAVFTQTMLLDRDSAEKIDKETGIMPITAKILEYYKDWNGQTVKTFIPLVKTFEYDTNGIEEEKVNKIINKLFKVKKGVTEITFEGEFIKSGSVVNTTFDDLPDDIKDLVEIGAYTEEEALAKCADNSKTYERMVINKPLIKLVGEDKTPVLQKFDEKYTEDDLLLDCMINTENNKSDKNIEVNDTDTVDNIDDSDDSDDMAWLNNLE